MSTKKPDPSVLGSNIQPLDAEALATAAGPPKSTGSETIDPDVMAAAIAHVMAMQGRETSPAPQTKPRMRKIILDPHADIPPRGGLYVGYNGRQFLLPTNRAILVPQGVIEVLDVAVVDVPVIDPDTLKLIGSHPAKRFQYRFTNDDPGKLAA